MDSLKSLHHYFPHVQHPLDYMNIKESPLSRLAVGGSLIAGGLYLLFNSKVKEVLQNSITTQLEKWGMAQKKVIRISVNILQAGIFCTVVGCYAIAIHALGLGLSFLLTGALLVVKSNAIDKIKQLHETPPPSPAIDWKKTLIGAGVAAAGIYCVTTADFKMEFLVDLFKDFNFIPKKLSELFQRVDADRRRLDEFEVEDMENNPFHKPKEMDNDKEEEIRVEEEENPDSGSALEPTTSTLLEGSTVDSAIEALKLLLNNRRQDRAEALLGS